MCAYLYIHIYIYVHMYYVCQRVWHPAASATTVSSRFLPVLLPARHLVPVKTVILSSSLLGSIRTHF